MHKRNKLGNSHGGKPTISCFFFFSHFAIFHSFHGFRGDDRSGASVACARHALVAPHETAAVEWEELIRLAGDLMENANRERADLGLEDREENWRGKKAIHDALSAKLSMRRKVRTMETDLPASLAVGDGAFKRRTVRAFRCCAALCESARELHQVVYGFCEWLAAGLSNNMGLQDSAPQSCLRDMCLTTKKLALLQLNRISKHGSSELRPAYLREQHTALSCSCKLRATPTQAGCC
jgi:hypothetical protein